MNPRSGLLRTLADEPDRALELHARGEQPLDDQVVQVTSDSVAVLEHGEPLGVATSFGELEGNRRLRGETRQGAIDGGVVCRREAGQREDAAGRLVLPA